MCLCRDGWFFVHAESPVQRTFRYPSRGKADGPGRCEENRNRCRDKAVAGTHQTLQRIKGYNLLWKDMRYVREVSFESFELLRLGIMSEAFSILCNSEDY